MRMIDAERLSNELKAYRQQYFGYGWHNEYAVLSQCLSLIDAQPTLTPPNEWISVEERLPEKDGSYLVHSGKSNTVYAAHFGKRDGRWSGKSKNLFITHWMPMPELPERSNNETD